MFAAIFIAHFPLQVVLRQEPELRGRCVALLNKALPACVVDFSEESSACGVFCGMTSAQAQGRCPRIVFRTLGDPTLEVARSCVLQCAGVFSPWMEATADGLVTMEWRVWRGKEEEEGARRLLREMVISLERVGFAATAGGAGNPDLAALAARCAKPVLLLLGNTTEFLSRLPLEMLVQEVSTGETDSAREGRAQALRILKKWGVRTFGQLTALPKAQLVERLGPESAVLWDLAAGCSTRLLKLVRVPEIFLEIQEFEQEVETLEPLLFVLRRFMEQIVARLDAAHRVAAVLRIRLQFARGIPYERELKVPSPTVSVEALFRMITTHLEGVRAEAPIVAVELEAQPAVPQRPQFELFSSRLRDPNQFFETLARLTAVFGSERVGIPVLVDSHRSDAFQMEVPQFDDAQAQGAEESLAGGLPLRHFRPPVKIQVRSENGFPVEVSCDRVSGQIHERRGPWLSSGDWWTGQPWLRIEWDVRVEGGLYRLLQDAEGWKLEGVYD